MESALVSKDGQACRDMHATYLLLLQRQNG
jgi:hypothetical protein